MAGNGYAFGCVECKFYIDVACGFIPENITDESHKNHILRVSMIDYDGKCDMCFRCSSCEGHVECALLLPPTIKHAYDKHPMQLSYLPIGNHNIEYFCEICEKPTPTTRNTFIYWFLNAKFGSIHKTDGHPHHLSFVQGMASDGQSVQYVL
ncbi:hypothetical protein Hanom_Chr10g00957131 [Helianthus anomalus]